MCVPNFEILCWLVIAQTIFQSEFLPKFLNFRKEKKKKNTVRVTNANILF